MQFLRATEIANKEIQSKHAIIKLSQKLDIYFEQKSIFNTKEQKVKFKLGENE